LKLIQLVINAALRKQLLMRTDFAHTALVHDDDLIALLNRRKAMCNDDRCTPFHESIDRLSDPDFRLSINAGRRFVQNKNSRIVGKPSCKSEQLPLPSRE